jgi:hypothetical protein
LVRAIDWQILSREQTFIAPSVATQQASFLSTKVTVFTILQAPFAMWHCDFSVRPVVDAFVERTHQSVTKRSILASHIDACHMRYVVDLSPALASNRAMY